MGEADNDLRPTNLSNLRENKQQESTMHCEENILKSLNVREAFDVKNTECLFQWIECALENISNVHCAY